MLWRGKPVKYLGIYQLTLNGLSVKWKDLCFFFHSETSHISYKSAFQKLFHYSLGHQKVNKKKKGSCAIIDWGSLLQEINSYFRPVVWNVNLDTLLPNGGCKMKLSAFLAHTEHHQTQISWLRHEMKLEDITSSERSTNATKSQGDFGHSKPKCNNELVYNFWFYNRSQLNRMAVS